MANHQACCAEKGTIGNDCRCSLGAEPNAGRNDSCTDGVRKPRHRAGKRARCLLPDSSYSLGATRIETIGVVLRQIAPAIATAILLSIGRAIGDCAGVMFTAGFSDHIPHGLNQQAATLPLSVFFQLSAPQEDVQNRAYAAAVVLTIIVLVLSFGGRFIMSHFSKNKI